MKIKILGTGLAMLLSTHALAQAAPAESPSAIQANFSIENIHAYQDKSEIKVKEFYEYLNLYSKEKNSDLRNQIEQSIYNLMDNEDARVLDFTEINSTGISIKKLLRKLIDSQLQFKVESISASKNIESNHWVNEYSVSVSGNNINSQKRVQQIIYFRPVNKQFGSKTKSVWELKLGVIIP